MTLEDSETTDACVFLRDVKRIVSLGSDRNPTLIICRIRGKNTISINELGLTFKDIREEILSLSTEHYYAGPAPDKNAEGDVWVFKKVIMEREIYIKLKIQCGKRDEKVRVISFHL